jgi:hypothetical protein
MGLDPNARVCRSSGHLSCDLNGEVAILNLDSKLYFGVTQVGAFIWRLLDSPSSVIAISEAVAIQFDVDPDRCAADVQRFLGELEAAGLIDIGSARDSAD